MELYYKLLDLIEGKYTTHETLEEVHHYITHRVSDMQYNYKVTDKLIRTPFPNYNFHYVIVEDDNEFREFVYFYDSIEEELDSRDDDRNKIIESLRNRINILEAGLKESERNTEYWKSRCKTLEEMLEKIRDVVSEFCYPF